MDWRGTERVGWSKERGEMNVAMRVQAATVVGQNLDRISTAAECFNPLGPM